MLALSSVVFMQQWVMVITNDSTNWVNVNIDFRKIKIKWKKPAFTSQSFVSETEWGTNYGKYKLHVRSSVGLCACWWQWVWRTRLRLWIDVLKKNKNKNNGDQSGPD